MLGGLAPSEGTAGAAAAALAASGSSVLGKTGGNCSSTMPALIRPRVPSASRLPSKGPSCNEHQRLPLSTAHCSGSGSASGLALPSAAWNSRLRRCGAATPDKPMYSSPSAS